MAISEPRPVSISVPTMALAMPPPASPTGRGIWVKNAKLSGLDALADDEEQHEGERHQRQRARTAAQKATNSDGHELAPEAAGIMRPTPRPRHDGRRDTPSRGLRPCSRSAAVKAS